MVSAPTKPGFYWAKWCIADDGTCEGDELTPSDEWEVVHVAENASDPNDPEYLMVMVPGVREWQSLENFVWGAGPLKREGPDSRFPVPGSRKAAAS